MNPTLFWESNDIEESSLTLHRIHRHGFKKQRETFFWNLRKKINYYLKFIGSTYKKNLCKYRCYVGRFGGNFRCQERFQTVPYNV